MAESKTCSKCNFVKDLTLFPKHPECRGGRKGVCKDCTRLQQNKYAKNSGNKSQKSYRKTPKGFVMQTYRNMLSRVCAGSPSLTTELANVVGKNSKIFWRNKQ